jgi:hypothetical protein
MRHSKRAKTIEQPKQADYPVDEETPSSGRDEDEEENVPEKKHCCYKNGALPPRNAIKKLISKELDHYAPLIFAELAKCKELNQPN